MPSYLHVIVFSLRASLRIEDAYLHVPGYHPTLDNSAFFRQRTDDPSVLPSLRKHLWGRVASLGSLILKAEKGIIITNRTTDSSTSPPVGDSVVKFTNDPLKIVGDGSSLMLEWSQPTVVAVARAVHHLKCEYKMFSLSAEAASDERGTEEKGLPQLSWKDLPPVDVKFRLADINAFLYSLVPGEARVSVCIQCTYYTYI